MPFVDTLGLMARTVDDIACSGARAEARAVAIDKASPRRASASAHPIWDEAEPDTKELLERSQPSSMQGLAFPPVKTS